MNRIARAASAPLRQYFNPRFEAVRSDLFELKARLAHVETSLDVPGTEVRSQLPFLDQRARQADWLERVDVSYHNRGGEPAAFDSLVWRAASAAQCEHPDYVRWWRLLENVGPDEPANTGRGGQYNRKVWEWAFICQSLQQHGLLEPGRRAIGFGVGNEPLPAVFARHGMAVLATDQSSEAGADWDEHGELNHGIDGLRRAHIVDDATLSRLVRLRDADMNALPDDLGTFDATWSSCVIEHLGSPARGLQFVLESLDLLAPGGVAVHTTELELTPQAETRDYGHCAVFRPQDLQAFAHTVRAAGYDVECNVHVPMDAPADRWISMVQVDGPEALPDWAHLKLVIGESVSTSYGMVIRKPL